MAIQRSLIALAALSSCLIVSACGEQEEPRSGEVLDEAMAVGRTAESFPAADEDYFREMDGAAALSPAEVKGRNTWIVWTAGNDRFWDYMANNTFGAFDLLKTLSSHQSLKYGRDNRWYYLGLVNEPCFEKATGPDPDYGLWLDKRIASADCPPDPFEKAEKYPGVEIGERGKGLDAGSFYGKASGIVGLRLFPNPDFDEAAREHWDGEKYYNDRDYYLDKDLVRPFRVGMSCGFCHVGPSPTNPPADPENPKWENLNSNPGAQYFWVDRIFFWDGNNAADNFVYQLFHTNPPGALDTSFVSTDNINNPRTMNAVYSIAARLGPAKRWGKETLAGGGLDNKQFNDFPQTAAFSDYFEAPDTVWTTRVLKDGSDSVGILGALNRVFLNIGLFSEEWLLHFNPLVGGKRITPIRIADAEKNSAYWRATAQQTPDMALFFVKTAQPDYLKDAPGGAAHLTTDTELLRRGKIVFAENCARCHSSKQPPNLCALGEPCNAGQIIENTAEYFDWMRTEVLKEDFLAGNFLSTERRIAVTELGTNACSPLATNALGGDIWDNFSSQTYKELPPVGTITVRNPVDGSPWQYEMPGGGRGYTRPASLISLWSTAPFLLNNSVGKFNSDPSVKGRMASFNDSIEKMLWPERRRKDPVLTGLGVEDVGYIYRTTERSYLRVAPGYLPDGLRALLSWGDWLRGLFPWLFDEGGGVEIGPIPKDTPIGLLTNLNPLSESTRLADRKAHFKKVVGLVLEIKKALKSLPEDASDEEARTAFRPLVPRLLELSKCPDFEVNRGHYFGSNLDDADKNALIEFLKTF